MFEGTYAPPFYLDLYNFKDGAQDDIFLDSYTYIPTPGPNQREVPTPVNQPIPQPSPTDSTDRNSVARTMGDPYALDSLFNAASLIAAFYAGGILVSFGFLHFSPSD